METRKPSQISGSIAPKRNVPALLGLRLLLGGFLNQFGWFFFGFGMVFFWAFAMRCDLVSGLAFHGSLTTIQGTITDSSDTGASEGGGKHSRGTPIYKNEFKYLVESKEYVGASYALGTKLTNNQTVTVEYPLTEPSTARIKGMRTQVFGAGAIFVLIFPLIGIIFLSIGVRNGIKACRLLSKGIHTIGKLSSQEPTNTRINNRPVVKFKFAFRAASGQEHLAVIKTHLVEKVLDDPEEHLVYDPQDPDQAVVLDSLQGEPHIDENDVINYCKPAQGLVAAIIPLISIVGHGAYCFYLLRG